MNRTLKLSCSSVYMFSSLKDDFNHCWADKKQALYTFFTGLKQRLVLLFNSKDLSTRFGFYLDQVYHVVLVALNQEAQKYKLVYQWLFPLSDSTNCVSLTKGESNLMFNSKVFTQHLALAIQL